MSKKMMKRSLALGALMAFVITGSAMAAEIVGERIVNNSELTIGIDGSICGQLGYKSGSAIENSGVININGVDKDNLVKFNNNTATDYAGAISNSVAGEMEIKYAQFKENKETSPNNGGGAILNKGQIKIENSSFEGNNGYRGGAINNQGTMEIYGSEFIGNTANATGSTGSAIHSSDTLYVENTLFQGNKCADADTRLRSVFVAGGTATFKNVEFLENIGGGINVSGADSEACIIGDENKFEGNTGTALSIANGGSVVIGENSKVTFDNNDLAVSLKNNNSEITFVEGSFVEFKDNGNDEDVAGAVRIADGTTVNFDGEAVFSNNIGKDGINDIENKGEVNIGSTGNVKVGSGYIGSGTTNINGGTIEFSANSNIAKLGGAGGNIKVGMASEANVAKVQIGEFVQGVNESNFVVGATGAVTDYIAGLSGAAQNDAMESVLDSVIVGEGADAYKLAGDTVTTDESLLAGAYTITRNEDGSVEATQAVNTKQDAVSDAGMTLKGHWRAHMNDMNKRMGELRNANGESGVWTRMVRGESEYQGAKMQYNQYQLGYDEKLSVDKRWTVGAAVTFSEGDASYGTGSTEDKSTAFAIYGSKLNNDGTFVDLIARYARIESDLDDRNYGTGDYDANGYSVSAEFGKRIQQGNGLWIEPQVELTYGSVDGAKVNFSKKFTANYDSMDSFVARAGFALGKDIKQGNVYARASYLYDFDGETKTQFEGGKAISEDFGGGWWEVGVGANINLSKVTYIYADVEKTFGGEVDTNWQWNLGVRYSF